MEMQGGKVVLVTGSSSGIGFETALLLTRAGFKTYASMRNLEKSKNITEIANKEKLPLQVVQLDVNDEGSVKDAIAKIVKADQRIDILSQVSYLMSFKVFQNNPIWRNINHNIHISFI